MKWTGLAVIGAVIAIQFFSLWWLCVMGVGLCVLVAGLLERENFRLRDELALCKAALEQGRAKQSTPSRQAADGFLQHLRQLGPMKPSSGQKED